MAIDQCEIHRYPESVEKSPSEGLARRAKKMLTELYYTYREWRSSLAPVSRELVRFSRICPERDERERASRIIFFCMILPIYTGQDNEMLRRKAKPVKKITKQTLKLIRNMKETLIHSHGLGLAAPQVGVSERILLANFQYGKKVGEKYAIVPLINAKIITHSDDQVLGEEGCLSLPDIYAPVKRYREITAQYLDERGQEKILELSNLNARIVQHEIDHLDGKLFVDYLDKDTIGKYEKELKESEKMVI